MHALIPRYDLWPETVQHAMRLRGALIPCGPGMRGAGWPDTPIVRLAAIGSHLDGGLVAAYLTAAWVWRAASDPGNPLSVASAAGSARRPAANDVRRFELRFAPEDIVRIGTFDVTSPTRTLLDLLHQPALFDVRTREACNNLLPLLPLSLHRMIDEVDRTRRPHSRFARARLREFLAEPESEPPWTRIRESSKGWTEGATHRI